MTLSFFLQLELSIFYFFDGRPQIENKAALIFFVVSKIFNFFLPDKIVDASAVPLIHESFPSQQDAIAWDYIELVKNDDISWHKLSRSYFFEPGVLAVDEEILLVFYLLALTPFTFLDSHLQLLHLLEAVEVVFNDL